ncbi:hypothetical protein ACFQ60_07735 [Streptomyces zhihengii]
MRHRRRAAAGAARAVLRLTAGTAVVAAGILLAPAAALLGTRPRHRLTASWCRAVLRAFGVRVTVVGAPPGRPVPRAAAAPANWSSPTTSPGSTSR